MAELLIDDSRLKAVFKAALHEVLEERRDLLRELIEESLEDIALGRAIQAGQRTEDANRSDVYSLLEGGH